MSVREICVKSYVAWKESVAMTFSTNCDLAIECLDFRVATIVVRMMKIKVATSRFSNFDSAIPGLVAMLHCRTLSFFGLKGTCRRLVRIRVVGLKSFRALIGPARRSSSMHTSLMVLSFRCPWCQGCGIGDVDLPFQRILCKNCTVEILQLEHSMFGHLHA